MTLEALKQAEQRTVGVKQTQKAVARQAAEVVYIASDADERVTGKLLELCEANHVPTVNTDANATLLRTFFQCRCSRFALQNLSAFANQLVNCRHIGTSFPNN